MRHSSSQERLLGHFFRIPKDLWNHPRHGSSKRAFELPTRSYTESAWNPWSKKGWLNLWNHPRHRSSKGLLNFRPDPALNLYGTHSPRSKDWLGLWNHPRHGSSKRRLNFPTYPALEQDGFHGPRSHVGWTLSRLS